MVYGVWCMCRFHLAQQVQLFHSVHFERLERRHYFSVALVRTKHWPTVVLAMLAMLVMLEAVGVLEALVVFSLVLLVVFLLLGGNWPAPLTNQSC